MAYEETPKMKELKRELKKLKRESRKRRIEIWISDKVELAKTGATKVVELVKEHPQETVGVIGGLGYLTKKVVRHHERRSEEKWKDSKFYDFRAHDWYYAKKPLSNSQKIELEKLYKAGMNKGEALKKMGLSK